MNKKGRNVAASVQAKLLQLSRNSKLSLQDLLERYCTERLLYRLSRSQYQSRFILKGASRARKDSRISVWVMTVLHRAPSA